MKRTKKKAKPLIFLTAGGTGGHVYPAEALAEELLKRGYRLALITDSRGKDNYKGHLGEIPNYAVWAGAMVGKSKWFKLKSLFKTCIGILQAGFLILKKRPKCVVGFGGYASFPASMAAILLGTDLILHEQNAVMSRTNRFLSKYASLIAQSFKNVKYTPANVKTLLTGMPVRGAIVKTGEGKYKERAAADVFQLLVLGGSQGAKVFSEVVPAAVAALDKSEQKKLKIFQQCRKDDVTLVENAYQGCGAEVVVSAFFDNMDELYASTDLIVSRAGASSVSEIAIAGLPSVLVPLPIAADDHQSYNARTLEEVKGAEVIRQKDFTPETLALILKEAIANPKKMKKMSDNAKKTAINDAAQRFADAVEREISAR